MEENVQAVVTELRKVADAVNSAADALATFFGGIEEPKVMTLPEVRAILAEKSRAGFREKVRELLLKYGSDKLSGIDPAKYAELIKETEEWTNAS